MNKFIYIADTCINLQRVKWAETLPSGISTDVVLNDGISIRLEGVTAKDFYNQIRRLRKEHD